MYGEERNSVYNYMKPRENLLFRRGKSNFTRHQLQSRAQFIEHLCRVKLVHRVDAFILFFFPFIKGLNSFLLLWQKIARSKEKKKEDELCAIYCAAWKVILVTFLTIKVKRSQNV